MATSKTINIFSGNRLVPKQPTVANLGTILTQTPTLLSSTFENVVNQASHVSSNWEVYNSLGNLVFSSYGDTTNLESITTSYLLDNASYTYRVQHVDESGSSAYSEFGTFSIPVTYVLQPSITSPTSGTTILQGQIGTVTSSHFSDSGGIDDLGSSSWELRSEDGTLIDSSYDDTSNLSSWTPDMSSVATEDGVFKVRVRHKGIFTDVSMWSEYVLVNNVGNMYLGVGENVYPPLTLYTQDVDTLSSISGRVNPPPVTATRGVSFSPNGVYMAVGTQDSNGVDTLGVYKRDGNSFSKLNPLEGYFSGGQFRSVFSPDNTYLVATHSNAPYATIFKRDGDTFYKLPDPENLYSSGFTGGDFFRDCAFSPDGLYLALVGIEDPKLSLFKRSGDTFTRLANPSISPSGTTYGVTFSHDNTYLACANQGLTPLHIYKRSGDTFTKLADPSVLPTSTSYDCAFSPDGTYLAVSNFAAPRVLIYKRSGDTFTKLADPSVLPSAITRSLSWSADGTYLAVATDISPYLLVYKRSGDTFTKLTDPSVLPSSLSLTVAYCPPAIPGGR